MEIGFPGYSVGGLAVGEGQGAMFETLEVTTPLLPRDKPRYLMGVGKPDDLVGAVAPGRAVMARPLPGTDRSISKMRPIKTIPRPSILRVTAPPHGTMRRPISTTSSERGNISQPPYCRGTIWRSTKP